MTSVAVGRPPLLSNDMILKVMTNYFNFKDVRQLSIKSLPSYRDRTYYLQGEVDEKDVYEFILKLSNPFSTSLEVIEGVNEVMKHLNSCGLLSPYPLPSKSGKELVVLTSDALTNRSGEVIAEDLKYPICVLSFIPGHVFDHVDKRYLTPSLLNEIGVLLGKIDKELMESFSSKALAARKNNDWDLMHFLDMKAYIKDIDDPEQKHNAERIFKAFKLHVSPKIPSFKRSIIHGDLNGLNIVVDKNQSDDSYHLAGFIDFNDCVKTCTIFDLGISLPYIMFENMRPVHCSNVIEFVGPLIGGYNSVLPLTQDELDSLYYLVLARSCQTALNGMRSFKIEPWNQYLLTTPQKSWILINELLNTSPEEVNQIWKSYMMA